MKNRYQLYAITTTGEWIVKDHLNGRTYEEGVTIAQCPTSEAAHLLRELLNEDWDGDHRPRNKPSTWHWLSAGLFSKRKTAEVDHA